MRSKIFFMTLVAASLVAFTANAATVSLSMITDGAGNWELYADDSLDNGGIASYNIPLLDVLTVDHISPWAQLHTPDFQPIGFSELRTADDATTIFGSQKLLPTPTPNIVYGFGQVGGDLNPIQDVGPTSFDQLVYGASVLLATGTYSLNPGDPRVDFDSDNLSVTVFRDQGAASPVDFADVVPGIPEPATLVLAGLAMIGVVGLRRRS
jgi:hypothetical protein